jgi:hypothetical protein
MSRTAKTALALRPNLGAEETGAPRGAAARAARAAGEAWRLLFPADAAWPGSEPPAWPDALPRDAGPAFPWLPDSGLCAWWNDAASAEAARREGRMLVGPEPSVVAAVHDKAFAARLCAEERIGPRWLAPLVRCFDPEELRDAARFRGALREALDAWPADLARTATLKPRLGTSGRGRVRASDPDDPEISGALPRLAARGGAVLEPWLERSADYSAQLHVARDGALTLLGTLELVVSPSGVYRGHRGELDHRGRVTSGAGFDDALIAAASEIARAAHAAGYYGPCGVDAFTFRRDGEKILRPIVELNARFTTGTVAIGLLRRARPWLEASVPPEPGERRSFAFRLGEHAGDLLPAARARLSFGGVAELACAAVPLPAPGD